MSNFEWSHYLSKVLRHQAARLGLHIEANGFVKLRSILDHRETIRKFGRSENTAHIEQIVRECEKQRFKLIRHEDGQLYIRANQGHSGKVADVIDPEKLLREVFYPEEIPCVLHGTYSEFWEPIKSRGLSKMSRQMIHFARGLPGKDGVISGMRKTCDMFIYIDARKAMAAGIRFFMSANGVILSEGVDGYISPDFFARVDFKDGRRCEVIAGPLPEGGGTAAELVVPIESKKSRKSDGDGETKL